MASGETQRLHPAHRVQPAGRYPQRRAAAGELLIIGGPFGVGKTIWGLQVARNAGLRRPRRRGHVVCYEHDRTHLLSRLLCLESAERGLRDEALTLRKILS